MASDVSPVALFYNEKRGSEKLIYSAFPFCKQTFTKHWLFKIVHLSNDDGWLFDD